MKNQFSLRTLCICIALASACLVSCGKTETDAPAPTETRATNLHPLKIICAQDSQVVLGQVIVIGKTYEFEAPRSMFNQVVYLTLDEARPDDERQAERNFENAVEQTQLYDNLIDVKFLKPGEYTFTATSPSQDEPLRVTYRVLANEMEFFWPESVEPGVPFELFISVWSPEYPQADVSLKLTERIFKPASYTFIDKLGPGHFIIWFASKGAFDLEAVITNRATSGTPHCCVEFFSRPRFECITQDEHDPATGVSWFSNYFQCIVENPETDSSSNVCFNYIYSRAPRTSSAEESIYGASPANGPIQYNLMVKAGNATKITMPFTFERPDRTIPILGEPYTSETGNYWTIVYPRDTCYQYTSLTAVQ